MGRAVEPADFLHEIGGGATTLFMDGPNPGQPVRPLLNDPGDPLMLRLTLRTLLAWLDGVLPADEADAFADKLSSSASARMLVDRIRAVVAHPGLDSPKVIGRGLGPDANSVAEYLNNSLPADAVATFERVCIESDAHLAEVAACHRMLVEARNDPSIFEPPEPREIDRLLAATLGLAGNASVSTGTVEKHPEPQPVKPQQAASQAAEPSKTSMTAWAAVIMAVLLVGLLAGTLAWKLMPGRSGEVMPRNADAVAVREPPPEPPRAPEEPAVEPPPAAPQTEEAAAKNEEEVPKQDPTRETAVVAPSREPEATVAAAEDPKPKVGRVPGGDALAIGAKATPVAVEPAATTPTKPVPAAPPPQPAPDEPAFATVGGIPLLLKRIGETGGPADWAVLAAESPLSASADLLVPEGFFPTLSVGKATIRLIGPARAVLRPRDDAAAEIELVFGRAIVGGIEAGRPMAFVAGQLAGRLEAGDPIGLEVRFDRAAGSDPAAEPATTVGSIAFPAGGRLALEPGIAAIAVPDAGLIRPDGSVATGVVVTGRGEASRGLPEWLASPSAQRLLDRLAADALAASLASAPPPAALERLLEDNRLENRSAAAATLAVMGRYEPLAEMLAKEEQGLRLPARAWASLERATVPLAIARGPTSEVRLLAAFEPVVPPDDGKLVRQLVVGFSNESLAEGGDAVLVAALEHPSLLIRRLAASRLHGAVPLATADRLRYRPDGPPDARAEAVKWWRTQLEKGRIRGGGEGGLSKAEGE